MLVFASLIGGCSSDFDKKQGSQTKTDSSENTNTENKDKAMEKLLESRHTLRFDESGEFKILVLSDIHGHAKTLDKETKSNIKTLIDKENPDLVIFDGDNTWQINNESTLKSCIGEMVSYIEEKKIPWAHTYGNHDAEGSNVPKKRQQKVYESFEYCISKAGDSNLTGIGNYVLPIYSSKDDTVSFAVWVLDSGSDIDPIEKKALFPSKFPYEGMPDSNYDYIHFDQINWYYESSKALEEYIGKKVPGLMAFHIPLQESFTAWENRAKLKYTGDKREYVCASAVNSGMFSALMQRGDIKAVVNGHDHINDFMIEYNGIKLCQVSTPTNENIYHDDSLSGGRVFVIKESNPKKVETYISYVNEK